MSLSSIPKSLRVAVIERDQQHCRYCGVLQVGQSAVFHVDHIIPRSKGGITILENLALQCPHCSLRKSNKTEAVDPESEAVVRLFHPLADAWSEHFALAEDGIILGKSAIGRATVESMSMNDSWPRSARALQIAAGWLHP